MELTVTLRHDEARYAIFKYFWVIALLPKAVQLVALVAVLFLMAAKTDRKLQPDGFVWLQVFCVALHGLSIVVNTVLGDHAMGRIFAAVNTCCITFVAVCYYLFYRRIQLDYRRISRYAVANLLILLAMWLLYRVTDGKVSPRIFNRDLLAEDWVSGVQDFRFIGYLDYANLVIFMVMFFYPLAMITLHRCRICALALTAGLFLAIRDTNSRTGLIIMAALVLAYVILELQKVFFNIYRRRRAQTWIFALMLLAAGVVVCYDVILVVLDKIINLREGSNSMRLYIYELSMDKLLTESPILGIAIKDMLDFGAQQYPLGSHSTYLGMFYKIGILGGGVYLISMIAIAIKALKSKDKDQHMLMLKVSILAALGLMVLEDIDGANWCVCIFYSLLAMVQNPGWKTEKKEKVIES